MLVILLEDDRWEVVKEALIGLGKLSTPVASRVTGFLTHEIADVRIAAAQALGGIGGNSAVEALSAALSDPDTGVQKAAKRAIEEIKLADREG
jgi:HEAT repeat protein